MTPEHADHLRDLFLEARNTATTAFSAISKEAFAADDAAVKAFMDALAEMVNK